MGDEKVIIGLSKKIKKLRMERNFTMEKLAQIAGCSKAYISQIEKAQVQPSVSILNRLANALGIPVSELFRRSSNGDARQWKLKRGERRHISYPGGKIVSHLLTKGVFSKKMQPLISIIKPQGAMGSDELLTHPAGTEEFVLVLRGEIYFEIGKESLTLKEGDTIYFEGNLPHRWENKSDHETEVLFMWTPPVW